MLQIKVWLNNTEEMSVMDTALRTIYAMRTPGATAVGGRVVENAEVVSITDAPKRGRGRPKKDTPEKAPHSTDAAQLSLPTETPAAAAPAPAKVEEFPPVSIEDATQVLQELAAIKSLGVPAAMELLNKKRLRDLTPEERAIFVVRAKAKIQAAQ